MYIIYYILYVIYFILCYVSYYILYIEYYIIYIYYFLFNLFYVLYTIYYYIYTYILYVVLFKYTYLLTITLSYFDRKFTITLWSLALLTRLEIDGSPAWSHTSQIASGRPFSGWKTIATWCNMWIGSRKSRKSYVFFLCIVRVYCMKIIKYWCVYIIYIYIARALYKNVGCRWPGSLNFLSERPYVCQYKCTIIRSRVF